MTAFGFLCTGGSAYAARPDSTPAVRVQIVLNSTRTVAGRSIKGAAILTNLTDTRLTVEDCAADGWLEVGLVSSDITFEPINLGIACPPSVYLAPGRNRFPFTISTRYQMCLQRDGKATARIPRCASARRGRTDNVEPPLPAGLYLTKVVVTGLPPGSEVAKAISIRLLSKS